MVVTFFDKFLLFACSAIIVLFNSSFCFANNIEHNTLTDELFFTEKINLNFPGLEKVKAAVRSGDFITARLKYVEYLKNRESPLLYFNYRDFYNEKERIAGFNTESADKISNNLITAQGVSYQFGDKIIWTFNPTNPLNLDWNTTLNRHEYWITLAKAYWATGNEKYAKAFVRQLRSWIIDCPMPEKRDNVANSPWRTLDAGIRMESSWIEVLYRFLPSREFDAESIILMVKSIHNHATYLSKFSVNNFNWRTTEMGGLYHISVMFPEFMESPYWEKQSIGELYKEMQQQFYPDGAQKELSPNYHTIVLNSFINVLRLAKRNSRSLPEGFLQRMENMYEYYIKIVFFNGNAPAVNDSEWGVAAIEKLREGYELFPERKDFLYVASSGREGQKPSFTSSWMPWAGWYTMRSGWDNDNMQLHFEVGPFGARHSHEDKLSFIIYAFGSRLLTECGVYPYDHSEWRKYAVSSRGHNVSRIDGKDQNREGVQDRNNVRIVQTRLTNRWISNSKCDFGEGWYDEGFGPDNDSTITQYRAFLFIKNKCWLMLDIFSPKDNDNHSYDSFFHLDASEASMNTRFLSVSSTNTNSANLRIIPLNNDGLKVEIIKGQSAPEYQGWKHLRQNICSSIATPIYSRNAVGQLVEPYLFLPFKAKDDLDVMNISKQRINKYSIYYIYFNDGSTLRVKYKVSGDRLEKLSYKFEDHVNGVINSAQVL